MQIGLGANTVGANGSSGGRSFLSDMRIRKLSVYVQVAGTSSGAGNSANLMCLGTYVTGFGGTAPFTLATTTGTNTLVAVALGSSAQFAVTTTTDLNVRVVAGSTLFWKNGTDATGKYDATVETYIDPEGSWTGPNS
jgi:hypothetical protein